ncbi:MAG: glycosyltransferase, partial [Leptospiraceae bacterium]|nr:glycosyltransferase [Leptospiraceae bacterium]
MRIELIGHNDGPSGAGKAMARLHSGLLGQGISSTMHVAQSHSLLEQTRMPEGSHRAIRSLRAVLGRIPLKAIYPHRSASSHFSTNFGAGGALRGILKTAPELLHFHWINGGFCHVAEFKTPRVPMVWTIHDSWPFTGGCHVIGDCERFTQSCGSCPQLRSSSKWDLSRVQHRTKRKAYA